MKMSFVRAAAFGLLVCSLPLQVFASATPQTLLQKSITATFEDPGAWALNGRFDIDIRQDASRTAKASSQSAVFRFMQRLLPSNMGQRDGEGQVGWEIVKKSGTMAGSSPISAFSTPVSFEWKRTGLVTYMRIKMDLPETLKETLGVDLRAFIGQWIKLDVSDPNLASFREGLPTLTTSSSSPLPSWGKDVFSVTRRISRAKGTDGHVHTRYVLRVDPRFIQRAEQQSLAEARTLHSSAAELRQIRSQYAALRRLANAFTFVAGLDETTGRLERFEVAGTVRMTPDVCKALMGTSSACSAPASTIKVKGGVSFIPQQSKPIEIPPASVDVATVIAQWFGSLSEGE